VNFDKKIKLWRWSCKSGVDLKN